MAIVTHIIFQCPHCKECKRVRVEGLWGPIHDDRLCDNGERIDKRKIVGYTLQADDGTSRDIV